MTTRRGFFKLMAGAAAMAAVPSIAVPNIAPTIFCNGIDCDSAGLDALIRGKVVQFSNPELAAQIGWRGNVLQLAGDFVIKSPIKPGTHLSHKVLTGGKFELHSSLFDLTDTQSFTVSHCIFNMDRCGPGDYAIKLRDNVQYGVGA
jgi:hypothetical protein